MIKPVRIQLSRRKGFNLQAHSRVLNGLPAVNVARPSKWGNPFKVGVDAIDVDEAVGLYEQWLRDTIDGIWDDPGAVWIVDHIEKLRGKNLACWCPLDAPCHADILLRIANGDADD